MDVSREVGSLTRGFPSAYPNDEVALAFILCVPGAGYGWIKHDKSSEIYGESYTQTRPSPTIWDMYAQPDQQKRYLETVDASSPISLVPDSSTKEWVEQCLALIARARTLNISSRAMGEYERIEVDLKARFPNLAPIVKDDPEKWAKKFAEVRAAMSEERKSEQQARVDKFTEECVRDTLNNKSCEATYTSPEVEAAKKAILDAGAEYLFEDISKCGRGLRYRVVVKHKLDPHSFLNLFGSREVSKWEAEGAKRILTPEEYVQWCKNDAWQQQVSRFRNGGEDAYGANAEHLFYKGMLHAFSAPWTWPLIERAIEIFGEPQEENGTLTFTPLFAPYNYNMNPAPMGIKDAHRTYEYKYDNWQGGELPIYGEPRYYVGWDLLVKGVVVPIGGKNYRVRYPLAQILADDPELQNAEYGVYPDAAAPVIMEETSDPIAPYSNDPKSEWDFQFFGEAHWTQNVHYPVWKGRSGYVLFSLNDRWGDCGTTNILFCDDENGKPVRIFHEASCS